MVRETRRAHAGRAEYVSFGLCCLKALKVDRERLEGLSREELVSVIHYLRAANINRGRLIDRLEDENYRLRGGDNNDN